MYLVSEAHISSITLFKRSSTGLSKLCEEGMRRSKIKGRSQTEMERKYQRLVRNELMGNNQLYLQEQKTMEETIMHQYAVCNFAQKRSMRILYTLCNTFSFSRCLVSDLV